MKERVEAYEETKRAIRTKRASETRLATDPDDFDQDLFESSGWQVGLSDVVQVGSKVLIGGGLGLLAGVATIAVAASAAEVVLVGAITKVAGVVGGAAGLSLGIRSFKSKKNRA